jgi:hypothetical protein
MYELVLDGGWSMLDGIREMVDWLVVGVDGDGDGAGAGGCGSTRYDSACMQYCK